MGVARIFFGGGDTVRKFSKDLLRKLRKMYYFSIFFQKINKPCVNFFAFGGKTQIVGNFEKIFANFPKLLQKIAKNSII